MVKDWLWNAEQRNECEYCGDYFIGRTSQARFCSDKCRYASYARDQKIRREQDHPIITKTCQECKKEFRTTTYKEKFCSNYCKDIQAGKKNIEKWVNEKPVKRKRQNLSMQMFYDLRDKPSDSSLKRFKACRG